MGPLLLALPFPNQIQSSVKREMTGSLRSWPWGRVSSFFVLGLLTLVVSNLASSLIIAVAHSLVFLYEGEPPSPALQQFLKDVIAWTVDEAPLVNWLGVLACAALLRIRSRVSSWPNYFSFVGGAWLSVLPFTLQPELPEMHSFLPQFGRFCITLGFALTGVFLGARVHARAEGKAENAWKVREAANGEQLVLALSQVRSGPPLVVSLFSLADEEKPRLELEASTSKVFAQFSGHEVSEVLNWPRLMGEKAIILHPSPLLGAGLPSRLFCYLLAVEGSPRSLLIVAPSRRFLFFRGVHRFRDLAEGAQLSLGHQALLRGAEQSARDGERERVSYEIHDHLAQDLISALMQLEAGRAHLGKLEPAVGDSLSAVEATLRRALTQARDLAWKFHGESRAQQSLRLTLEKAVHEFEKSQNIETQFLAVGDESEQAPQRDAILVSGLREALNNIKKHAMARKVHVTLSHISGSIALDVCDNGRGMASSPLKALIGEGGFGLPALRRRVEGAGGRLFVEQAPLGGTALSIQFPASRQSLS